MREIEGKLYDDFSVTITLSPFLNGFGYESQKKYSRQGVIDCINSLKPHDYVLTEELTKAGNLHYHAYLVFETLQSKAYLEGKIRDFNKDIIGFIKVRRTYDSENWLKYMHKNEADGHNLNKTPSKKENEKAEP